MVPGPPPHPLAETAPRCWHVRDHPYGFAMAVPADHPDRLRAAPPHRGHRPVRGRSVPGVGHVRLPRRATVPTTAGKSTSASTRCSTRSTPRAGTATRRSGARAPGPSSTAPRTPRARSSPGPGPPGETPAQPARRALRGHRVRPFRLTVDGVLFGLVIEDDDEGELGRALPGPPRLRRAVGRPVRHLSADLAAAPVRKPSSAEAPGCVSVLSWVSSGATPIVIEPMTPFAMRLLSYVSLSRPPSSRSGRRWCPR